MLYFRWYKYIFFPIKIRNDNRQQYIEGNFAKNTDLDFPHKLDILKVLTKEESMICRINRRNW